MVKKTKIVATLATLLIAAAGVITFEACNKKNEVINSAPQMVQNKGIVYQNEVPDREAYILEFEKKLQSGAKSEEVLTAENANAFMFDLLNFDFCNINGDGPDKTYETSTYTLNVSNGTIDLDEFANLYSQISSHVYDYYHSLSFDNKNYYCIEPEIAEFDANATTTTVTVKSTLTSGLSYRNFTYDSTLCDYFPADTLYQWQDAAVVLTDCFNMSIYHPCSSERYFFTCISDKDFYYYNYPQLYHCEGGCSIPNTKIPTIATNSEDTMCDLLNAYIDLAQDHCPHHKNIVNGVVDSHTATPVSDNTLEPTVLNHSLYVRYGIVTSTQIVVRL